MILLKFENYYLNFLYYLRNYKKVWENVLLIMKNREIANRSLVLTNANNVDWLMLKNAMLIKLELIVEYVHFLVLPIQFHYTIIHTVWKTRSIREDCFRANSNVSKTYREPKNVLEKITYLSRHVQNNTNRLENFYAIMNALLKNMKTLEKLAYQNW